MTRLTSEQHKIIVAAVAIAILSLAVSMRYFHRAFPEATLDLRVNRGDSETIARDFLASRGIEVAGYRHTAVFTYDENAKLYLERALGLEKMNQLTAGPIHLWRWSHRWFRPQQQEEFAVEVTPTGEVVGFGHTRGETDAGANLDLAAARAVAEKFLFEKMHRDQNSLEFLDADSNQRPARTDFHFTWKQKDVDLRDGSLRVTVGVQGDQVSSYTEYVKVPEQWQREYARIRSRNDSAQTVDEVLFYVLSAALLVMLVVRLRRHDVPGRTAAWFAAVAAILYFVSEANNFPLAQSWYSTTESYSAFVANYFGSRALAAGGVAAFIFVLVAAAEPEYRHGLPQLTPLRSYLSWKGLRTRSFFVANVVGLALAFFFFAYQTVFYLAANKLGAWAPSDVPFTNQLNTGVPWVAVLFMGFLPAVSEEMQFRAFAIPFLRRFVRSTPLAITLAAFNWGFLHSAYPNQPFFIRGLEVGLGGILLGFVMLRFGIVATLIWHYSVDALYSAFLLLRSPNHYLFASGAVSAGIMAAPLLVALACYVRSGYFEEEATQAPAETTPPALPEPTALDATIAYQPLSRRRRLVAIGLTIVLAALAFVPAYRTGKGAKVFMTAGEAMRAADAYMRNHGVEPARFHRVANFQFNVDPEAVQYLSEQAGVRRADEVYRRATQLFAWQVRYFRPLEIEEYQVIFDAGNGQFVDLRHRLDENAAGRSLDAAQARAIAEKALGDRGWNVSELELKESNQDKQKARDDFHYMFQAKPGDFRNVGEAKYRVSVNVAGDQVTSVSDEFKLPEAWSRAREHSGLTNALLTLAVSALGILLFALAVVRFVSEIRAGRIAWRAAVPIALLVAAVTVVAQLNGLATAEQGYSTSVSLQTFWLLTILRMLGATIFIALSAWVVTAFVFAVLPATASLSNRAARWVWRTDAAMGVVVVVAASAALHRFGLLLSDVRPTYFHVGFGAIPGAVDTWSPALAEFCSAVSATVFSSAALGVLIAIASDGWRRRKWWLWVGAILFLISLGPTNAHSIGEFAAVGAFKLLSTAVFCGIAAVFLRDNPLAYVAALFVLQVAPAAAELLSQGAALYVWNGVALAAAATVVLGWALLPRRAQTMEGQASAATP